MTQQNLHDAGRGSSQAVGIAGAGGGQPDGKEAGQTIQPIRQRQHDAGLALWQVAIGGRGLVVLGDGIRHRRRFPGALGVLAPHNPLQTRHLDHHAGGQIGLHQVRRALHHVDFHWGKLEPQRDPRCNRLQAMGFVQHRAEFGLEGELFQIV